MTQAQSTSRSDSRRVWLAAGLLFFATLVFWGRTSRYGFVWDDAFFIVQSPSLRSLANLPEMFTTLSAQGARAGEFRVFRPIRNVVYALLVWAGGGVPRPGLFHGTNVFVHALNGVLLLFLAHLLFRTWPPGGRDPGGAGEGTRPFAGKSALPWAVAAAAAFVVHPALTESVCWAKCLDDLLALAFLLSAALCLAAWPRRRFGYIAAFGFYVLAVYSKISALPFLVFVPMVVAWRSRNPRPLREAAVRTLPFAAAAGIYVFHRAGIIGGLEQARPLSGAWSQTLIDMLPVGTRYLRLLLGVPPFCCDYSFLHGGYSLASGPVLAGAGLLVAAAIACAAALGAPRLRPVGIGFLWTGLFLAPVSNVVPMMQYMAERFLYVPIAGWALALAGLAALPRPHFRRYTAAALAAIIGVWAFSAWQRMPAWRSDFTLFVGDALRCPKSARLRKNAVNSVLRLPIMRAALGGERIPGVRPDPGKVRAILEILGKQFPDRGEVSLAWGVFYLKHGDRARGIEALERAAKQIPDNPSVWCNLAQFYLDSREWERARRALLRALRAGGWDPAVREKLACWYRLRGRTADAARQAAWLRRRNRAGSRE